MLDALSALLWGWHVLGLILLAGGYFTLVTGFYQLRCVARWMKAALSRPAGERGAISSFQALTAALAGSIGTGNIVGVAAAITVGGPGSLFWMWVSALLGMMTIYGENFLAAKYREAPGALGYIRRAGKWGRRAWTGGVCAGALGHLQPAREQLHGRACAGRGRLCKKRRSAGRNAEKFFDFLLFFASLHARACLPCMRARPPPLGGGGCALFFYY